MLNERVVLVTGATGGLGRVVVKRLLAEGARVAAVYRSEERLRELEEYVGGGRGLVGYSADVTDAASVASMVEAVKRDHGRIDVLLNIAGGYTGGKPLNESEEADLDRMFSLNTRSAYLCSRAVLPSMIERNSGRIISVSAKNATPRGRRAGNIAYAISKAGVITMTEALAEEVVKLGITVNCIMPSTIDTPDNRENVPKANPSKWVNPDDIASVMLFLASDAARAVSGASIPVFWKS